MMINWYRSGIDPAREMIKLTTYLGHSSPSNPYWYIEAVPELLNRLEERQKLEPESENVTRVTPEEADEAPVDDPAGGYRCNLPDHEPATLTRIKA